MNSRDAFNRGAQFGALMMMGAVAVNALISRRNPLTGWHLYATLSIAVACFGGAWWLRRRAQRMLGTS